MLFRSQSPNVGRSDLAGSPFSKSVLVVSVSSTFSRILVSSGAAVGGRAGAVSRVGDGGSSCEVAVMGESWGWTGTASADAIGVASSLGTLRDIGASSSIASVSDSVRDYSRLVSVCSMFETRGKLKTKGDSSCIILPVIRTAHGVRGHSTLLHGRIMCDVPEVLMGTARLPS